MKNSTFKPNMYSISYDDKSGGYVVRSNQCTILKSDELVDLCKGILKFMDTYSDEEIEKTNIKNQEEWFDSLYTDHDPLDSPYHTCHFKKNAHIQEGIVYVFQDRASGHVRAVKTTEKAYESSIKRKQTASFEGIQILYKTTTKHQKLLSEFLNVKAEHIRNNLEYLLNEEYFVDLYKWINTYVKVTRYKCKNCKDIISSLETNSYIRCSKCYNNFCSVDCWNEHVCDGK